MMASIGCRSMSTRATKSKNWEIGPLPLPSRLPVRWSTRIKHMEKTADVGNSRSVDAAQRGNKSQAKEKTEKAKEGSRKRLPKPKVPIVEEGAERQYEYPVSMSTTALQTANAAKESGNHGKMSKPISVHTDAVNVPNQPLSSSDNGSMTTLSAETNDNGDGDLPSFKHLWSKTRGSARFKKGDVIMAKVLRYPRWPFIVSNINKNGYATLFELPRTFPIAKGSRPDLRIKAKKLERFRQSSCDLFENYRSMRIHDFITASKQAESIIRGRLNPFADEVDVQEEDDAPMLAEECEQKSPGIAESLYWGLEYSDGEDDDNDETDTGSHSLVTISKEKVRSPYDDDDILSPEALARCETLLDAIMSEETEAYLVKIMRYQEQCKRREEFLNLERTGRLYFRYRSCFPFVEEDHIEEAINFAVNLKRKHEPNLCGPNGDSYAQSVLMPEAIKFGLRKVWRLTEEEAETILNRFPDYFYEMELEKNADQDQAHETR